MPKNYSWSPSLSICNNCQYLKSIADTSVTQCNEVIIVMEIQIDK